MGISEDARAAADTINKRGWCQETEKNLDGEVCIVGAHNVSYGRNPYIFCEESEPFIGAIKDYVGMRAVDWNDEPGRTKQEVLDMLENVAIKYDTDEFRSNGNADG